MNNAQEKNKLHCVKQQLFSPNRTTRSRKHKHPDKGWEQKRGHDAENHKAQTRTIYLSGNCQLSASVGR